MGLLSPLSNTPDLPPKLADIGGVCVAIDAVPARAHKHGFTSPGGQLPLTAPCQRPRDFGHWGAFLRRIVF